MLEALIFTLLGIAGGVAAPKAYERWARSRENHSRRLSLLSGARKEKPALFVAPRCVWQHGGREEVAESPDALRRVFTEFTSSSESLLLLSGPYGMGKTSLAHYLISQVAEQPSSFADHLPVLINSHDLATDAIGHEIVSLVNAAASSQISELSLSDLINRERWLLFFDALDQLPYHTGESNRLDAIVVFIQRLTKAETFKGKIVLVARDEFLSHTSGLDPLTRGGTIPHLRVEGFPTVEKIREFVTLTAKRADPPHWAKLAELIHRDAKMLELFSRPITLSCYMKIAEHRLTSMGSTGTTIAEVFNLSVEDVSDEMKRQFEAIAHQMFVTRRYVLTLSDSPSADGLPSVESVLTLASLTGLVSIHQRRCQFLHAAYRDFFVALKYLRSIDTGQPQYLDRRQNNYLVSEFVAGLLDRRTIVELLNLYEGSTSTDLRINTLDVLAELENEELRAVAREYIGEEITKARTKEMDEYKVGLYTSAGVLGFPEVVTELIDHIKKVGSGVFFQTFFPTKDDFRYYEYSRERCETEWMNVASQRKYGEQRRLAAFLLGELGSDRALQILEGIADDGREPLNLRRTAREAVQKIGGGNADVQTKMKERAV